MKLTLKQQRFCDEYIISRNAVYGYVYLINNLVNHKKYIGITTRTVEKRFYEHSKAETLIGKAIRKYGEHNFNVSIIDTARDKVALYKLEEHYIREYGTYRNGYNQTLGGEGIKSYETIDVVLNEKQLAFVKLVALENQEEIDVNNTRNMLLSMLRNLMQIFLVCDRKADKVRAAKMILRLKRELLEFVIRHDVIAMDNLLKWAGMER